MTIQIRDRKNAQIVFNGTLEKLIYTKDNKKVAYGLYRLLNTKNYMSQVSLEKTLANWAIDARKEFNEQIKHQTKRA